MLQPIDQLQKFNSPSTIKRFIENHPMPEDEAQLIFDDLKQLLWFWNHYDKETTEEEKVDIGFAKSTRILEQMWQSFILSTRDYEEFSTNYLGIFHHHPRFTPIYDANIAKLGKEEAEEIYFAQMVELIMENLGEDITMRWFDTYLKYEDEAYLRKVEIMKDKKRLDYRAIKDIPHFTKEGFFVKKTPPELFAAITKFNEKSKELETDEYEEGSTLSNFIISDKHKIASGLRQIDSELRAMIINFIQPELENWTGLELFPTYVYGIRTYRRGANFKLHLDTMQTNVISVIINVDQKLDEEWALQIKNHEGELTELFLQPGEMCLYESATLEHGRVQPFNGDYYSNIFASFIPLS